MSDEKERGPAIIEAHQEMVGHIEQGARRMRALSILTEVVAAVLAFSYGLQLALPLGGTTSVTVHLTDPGNVAAELVVLGLALAWLYVGFRDLRFSSSMRRAIRVSRENEDELRARTVRND